MTDIGDVKSYQEPFKGKQQLALNEALAGLRHEVDLYWRRASYFWTLSTVAFSGFFALQTVATAPPTSLVTVSCVGFVFAWAWLLVNRASAHWLDGWVAQVDILEDAVTGPVYKTNVRPGSVWNPLAPYPFSATKVNLFLSMFITVLWLILIVYSTWRAGLGFTGSLTSSGTVLILTGTFAMLMFFVGRSSLEHKRTVAMMRREYE